MKKCIFILLCILLIPFTESEGIYYTKLRTAFNPDYLRIVLEGAEADILEGVVNQKGDDIFVRFPHGDIIVQEEKIVIPYKVDKNIIVFSPGAFKSFKVFSLKNPGRLVIDVYLKQKEKEPLHSIEAIRNELRGKTMPLFTPGQHRKHSRGQGVRIVVIDPGHGGYESGLVTDKYREKSVVLDIARTLGTLLGKNSKQYFLTRESDQFMSPGERIKFANSREADIFLSLHIGNHRDVAVYTPVITEEVPDEVKDFMLITGQEDYMEDTSALSGAMQKAIISDFNGDMVSSKPLPYSILSEIEAAALIIELPSLKDAAYGEELNTKFANALYRGILQYENRAAD